jgi:hypothetical protein
MNDIKFTLNDLSVDEINFILAGIQELPAKIANPLSQKLREQAQSQLPKQEEGPLSSIATPQQ